MWDSEALVRTAGEFDFLKLDDELDEEGAGGAATLPDLPEGKPKLSLSLSSESELGS
jgi:hypothetical protein